MRLEASDSKLEELVVGREEVTVVEVVAVGREDGWMLAARLDAGGDGMLTVGD